MNFFFPFYLFLIVNYFLSPLCTRARGVPLSEALGILGFLHIERKGIPWLSLFGHRADHGRRNDASIDRHRGALVLSSVLCPECPSPCPCCVAWKSTSEHEVVLVDCHQLPKCLAVRDILSSHEISLSHLPTSDEVRRYRQVGLLFPAASRRSFMPRRKSWPRFRPALNPPEQRLDHMLLFPPFFGKREYSPKKPRNRGFVCAEHEV